LFPDYVLLFYTFIICLGGFMSTLSMSEADQAICDEFDLYEYGTAYVVTMPNGYRFVLSNSTNEQNEKLERMGATIEHLSELGA
jgi:hypothetical protein